MKTSSEQNERAKINVIRKDEPIDEIKNKLIHFSHLNYL